MYVSCSYLVRYSLSWDGQEYFHLEKAYLAKGINPRKKNEGFDSAVCKTI